MFYKNQKNTILYPTIDEFFNSRSYLSNLGKICKNYGFSAIKPPNNWKHSVKLNIFTKRFNFIPQCLYTEDLKADDFKRTECKELTVEEFLDYADAIKRNQFKQPADLISTQQIENFFNEKVNDDYFLNECRNSRIYHCEIMALKAFKFAANNKYASTIWNLNDSIEHSVVKFANLNTILENKCCLEMCFSHSNWQKSDHCSYILDYLHWGDNKTWYIIPSEYSEKVQEIICKSNSTNLELISQDIPVYKIIQKAGEFLFLLPNVYFKTLSHGGNFCQRANYFPQEWLEYGIESWNSSERDKWLISFEEIVISLLEVKDNYLDNDGLLLLHNIAKQYFDDLISKRNEFLKEKYIYHETKLSLDNDLLCSVCNSICYFNYLKCQLCNGPLYCLNDAKYMCSCPHLNKCLYVTYTNTQLSEFITRIITKLEISESTSLQLQLMPYNSLDDINTNNESDILQTNNTSPISISNLSNFYIKLFDNLLNHNSTVNCNGNVLKNKDDKLTLDELNEFIDKAKRLSTVLGLEDKINEITIMICNTKLEIINIIKSKLLQLAEVEELLNKYSTFQIELPEIEALDLYRKMLLWIQRYKTVDENLNVEDINDEGRHILTQFQECLKSLNLKDNLEVVNITSRLISETEKIISSKKQRTERGISFLNQESIDMDDLSTFLKEESSFTKSISCFNQLKEAHFALQVWHAKANKILNEEPSPYIYVAVRLLKEADCICVKTKKYFEIKNEVAAADKWCEDAMNLFALKNSMFSFYEMISPKVMSSSLMIQGSRDVGNKFSTLHQFFIGWNDPLCDPSPSLVVDTYRQAELIDIQTMNILCENNERKSQSGPFCCVCQQQTRSRFVKCALCHDLCHTASSDTESCSTTTHPSSTLKLCLNCVRSKRPHLDELYPLLLSLQNISLRIPEGEGLQVLAERAGAWQVKAEEVLSSEEFAPYIAALSGDWPGRNELQDTPPVDTNALDSKRDSCIQKIKDLLLEGYMIEVQLDEIPNLERILSKLKVDTVPQPSVSTKPIIIRPDSQKNIVCDPEILKGNDQVKSKSNNYIKSIQSNSNYVSVLTTNHPQSETPASNTWYPAIKKMKMDKSADLVKVSQNVTINSTSHSTTEKIIKLEKSSKSKKKSRNKKAKEVVAVDDCSAANCLKPLGTEVDWVMCDRCFLWFHLTCLALNKSEIKEDEDFYCNQCKQK